MEVHSENLCEFCDSAQIRTADLLLRRQLLYPAELPSQGAEGGNRTRTILLSRDFKSLAATISPPRPADILPLDWLYW